MHSDVEDDTETTEEIISAVTDNTENITYSIKLISPLNQGDDKEKPKEWSNTKFSDVTRLRSEIKADFGTYFDGENFQIGYIKPGHGAGGRQIATHCLH